MSQGKAARRRATSESSSATIVPRYYDDGNNRKSDINYDADRNNGDEKLLHEDRYVSPSSPSPMTQLSPSSIPLSTSSPGASSSMRDNEAMHHAYATALHEMDRRSCLHSSPRGPLASQREQQLQSISSRNLSSNSSNSRNNSDINNYDDQLKTGYVTNLKLPNGNYSGQVILQPLDNNSQRKKKSSSNAYSTMNLKKGVLYEHNGDVYSGSWLDGRYSGLGKKEFRNGDVYVGNFSEGRRKGFGTFTSRGGDSYTGDWKDGFFNGIGKFVWAKSGEVYSGNWVGGCMTGHGKKVQVDGYIEGWFVDGCSHGMSRKAFKNGDVYNGNYSYNNKHGFGEYTWSDGSRYTGSWLHDHMSGQGEHFVAKKFARKYMISSSSSNCNSSFINSNNDTTSSSTGTNNTLSTTGEGEGEVFFDPNMPGSNFSTPRGEDTPSSPVSPSAKWTNLVYYKGSFIESCRHGFGVAVALNGDILIGSFDNNLPHGMCTCYSLSKNCLGRMLVYEGEYANAVKSGKGRYRAGSLQDFLHIIDSVPNSVLSKIKNLRKILPFLMDYKDAEDSFRRESVHGGSTCSSASGSSAAAGGQMGYNQISPNLMSDFDDLQSQLLPTLKKSSTRSKVELQAKYLDCFSQDRDENDLQPAISTIEEWKHRLSSGVTLLESIMFMQTNPVIKFLSPVYTSSNVHGQSITIAETVDVALEFIGCFSGDCPHGRGTISTIQVRENAEETSIENFTDTVNAEEGGIEIDDGPRQSTFRASTTVYFDKGHIII